MTGMKILPAIVLVASLTSCQALTDYVTSTLGAEQQEQLAAYQAEIDSLERQIEEVEAEAEATLKAAVAEAKTGTAESLSEYTSQLLALQEKHEKLVDSFTDTVNEERRFMDAAVKERTDGVLGAIAPLIPAPAQPLVPFASTLLLLAGSSRARRHTGKAAKALAKGNLADMGASLLKATGAQHSTNNSKAAADADEEQGIV